MSKRVGTRNDRRRARTSSARKAVARRGETGVTGGDTAGPGDLLDRLLSSAHLALVVPRLQPEVLHKVIQHCGLEDCGPLIALATPEQVSRLFDLDLWRAPAPGVDERFDADRFGLWLAVLLDAGESVAAATISGLDPDLIASALAQHVRVIDYAAVSPFITLDGELAFPGFLSDTALRREIGGFVVVAKDVAAGLQPREGSDSWDAITAVLAELSDTHSSAFERIMRRCCRLSSSLPEVDGLDDLLTPGDQATFDVGVGRETRLLARGYVTPAQARAFLQAARAVDRQGATMPPRDAMTQAYFGDLDREAGARSQSVAAEPAPANVSQSVSTASPGQADDAPAEAVAAILDLLQGAGAIPRPPLALLEAPSTGAPRLVRIRALLQYAHAHDPMASTLRHGELAYLANVLVAGSTIQSRSIAADEASQAVLAVCNLGLEHWPIQWHTYVGQGFSPADMLPEDFLIRCDLVRAFQVGWAVLYEEVCMNAAAALIAALATARCADDYIRDGLETLRAALTKAWRTGTPWDAREALEVIATLDTPSWAAVAGLIGEFPVLHAALGASVDGGSHRIDPMAFEFISEAAQIRKAEDFMQILAGVLRG